MQHSGFFDVQTFMYIGRGFDFLVVLGMQCALLGIIATAVRRYRPDMFVYLLLVGLARLVLSIVGPLTAVGSTFIAGRYSIDTLLTTQVVVGFILTVVNATLAGFFFYGFYRLVLPPTSGDGLH